MHEGAKHEQTPDSWRRRDSGERRIEESPEPPRSTTFDKGERIPIRPAQCTEVDSDDEAWVASEEECPTEPRASAAPLSEPPDTLRPDAVEDMARDTIPAPPPRDED